MMDTENTTPTVEQPTPDALLAEFDGERALVAAAERVREAGYRRWDAHSPYPVHGIDRAMGIRPTILPWLVLGGGITGGAVALLMQWWMNAVDYPLIISGKPLFSLPANIPVTFELIVLFSAFAAFGGVLVLNFLPEYWHPAFSSKRFARVTTDGFFITIEASDPKFEVESTREFLESLGAEAVEVCYNPAKGRAIPKALYVTAAVAALLAVIPPLLIARARSVPSTKPRIHPIQDMDFQPRFQGQAATPFFSDRRTMRPNIPGTIAVGQVDANDHVFRGLVDGKPAATFPMPVTKALMERGRERFNIYCAACHGLAGDGDGMTHERVNQRITAGTPGYATWVQPASLHKASIVAQPVGQIFGTITNGLNTMPSYAAQVPVKDRWAIVAYVKALQRSQNARIEDVPEDTRNELH